MSEPQIVFCGVVSGQDDDGYEERILRPDATTEKCGNCHRRIAVTPEIRAAVAAGEVVTKCTGCTTPEERRDTLIGYGMLQPCDCVGGRCGLPPDGMFNVVSDVTSLRVSSHVAATTVVVKLVALLKDLLLTDIGKGLSDAEQRELAGILNAEPGNTSECGSNEDFHTPRVSDDGEPLAFSVEVTAGGEARLLGPEDLNKTMVAAVMRGFAARVERLAETGGDVKTGQYL